MTDGKISISGNENGMVSLLTNMANRHGLIVGATGTGKTVTLQTQEHYQIIEASVSRVDSSLFEVVHPSLLGFKDKMIKPEKPLQIKDWKVKSSVVLGSLIGNGYTLTTVFTLRNPINQYRNISMVYEF